MFCFRETLIGYFMFYEEQKRAASSVDYGHGRRKFFYLPSDRYNIFQSFGVERLMLSINVQGSCCT